jgi:formylglycine-generating enzyme required for sulfatase activity
MRLTQNPEVRNNPALLVNYLSQRAGLLVPRGVGVYTFPHRTFQEYLAACHLTDLDYPDQVAELARDDPNRWREVALLAGAKAARGTASAVWSLVDALCYQALPEGAAQSEPDAWGALLAGQALVESADLDKVSERNWAKVGRVVTHLMRVVEEGQLPAVERAAAGRALARLGDPRPGVGLASPPLLAGEGPGVGTVPPPLLAGEGPGVGALPNLAWRQVPAGPFPMGSIAEDEMAYGDEKPQHTYEIQQPYAISRYPVTNAQYAAFVRAGGYTERRYWTEAGWAWREDGNITGPEEYGAPYNLPNHPVVGVSWYEAVAFCRWLTEELRRGKELTESQEITLPTEPQWEKAARGTDGRLYPWGNDPDPEKANYGDTGVGTTSAVGCFPGGASPYGVEDLSGNVWEWTRSLWGTNWQEPDFGYPYDPADGREDLGARDEMLRVLRGGAFSLDSRLVRCASRWYYPNLRYWHLGFRVVLSPYL